MWEEGKTTKDAEVQTEDPQESTTHNTQVLVETTDPSALQPLWTQVSQKSSVGSSHSFSKKGTLVAAGRAKTKRLNFSYACG